MPKVLKWSLKWKSLICVRLFATPWLYSPWNSPGQNAGVGSLSLLQGSSQPRDRTQVSHIAGGYFTSWATKEAPKWSLMIRKWLLSVTVRKMQVKTVTSYCSQPSDLQNLKTWQYTLFRKHSRTLLLELQSCSQQKEGMLAISHKSRYVITLWPSNLISGN